MVVVVEDDQCTELYSLPNVTVNEEEEEGSDERNLMILVLVTVAVFVLGKHSHLWKVNFVRYESVSAVVSAAVVEGGWVVLALWDIW